MAEVKIHGAYDLFFRGKTYSIADGEVSIDFMNEELTQLGHTENFMAKLRPNKMTVKVYRSLNFDYRECVEARGELIAVKGLDGVVYQLNSGTFTKSDGEMSISNGEFDMEFSGPTGSGTFA